MNSIKREEDTSFGAAESDQSTRPDVSEVRLLFYNSSLVQHSYGGLPRDPGRGQFIENGSYNPVPSVVQNMFGDIVHMSAGVKSNDSV